MKRYEKNFKGASLQEGFHHILHKIPHVPSEVFYLFIITLFKLTLKSEFANSGLSNLLTTCQAVLSRKILFFGLVLIGGRVA